MRKILQIFVIAYLCSITTYGQVKFKLTRQADRQTYVVSMVSEETYEGNQKITGTAQVTLKVGATNDFSMREITSLQPEINWVNNAMISKPELAPTFTYISFGMQTMAHAQFNYKKGEEIALFSFKNVGDVKAKVSLINNAQDIMAISSQKTKYNVQNYISILGHGPGNAYISNVEPVAMSPENAMKTYVNIINIYPNPTTNKVSITWENQLEDTEDVQKMDLLFFDVLGLEKLRMPVSSGYGKQSQEIELSSFGGGMYFVKMQRDEKYDTNAHKLVVLK